MPNYVSNIVTFRTKNKKIMELIKGSVQEFDFQKILPMPETLMITEGSETDYGKAAYLYSLYGQHIPSYAKCPSTIIDLMMPSWEAEYDKYVSQAVDFIQKNAPVYGKATQEHPFGEKSPDISYLYKENNGCPVIKCQADYIELGKLWILNKIRYGHGTWYSWCCENWGTKWNSMPVHETPFDYESFMQDNQAVYTFLTAWNMPEGIFNHLKQLFLLKELEVYWEYADEDIGNNCGIIKKLYGETEFSIAKPDKKSAGNIQNFCSMILPME